MNGLPIQAPNQLKIGNPYKSKHEKRILQEHYNILCKDDDEGPPVFKL